MRPDIRGIVFDKDGTLFDFNATWAVWCAGFIEEIGGDDPVRSAVLAEAMGFDRGARRFDRGSPVVAETIDVLIALIVQALPELGAAHLRQTILRSTSAARQVPTTPLEPLLDLLRAQGFTLGVATNDGEEPARAHLGRAGVLERFAFVAGFDSGHGGKPGPGMLHAFCRETGLTEAACVMVGDSTHDLVSGRAAGMGAVAVLTGIADEAELAPHADVVLPDISALPAWLGIAAA